MKYRDEELSVNKWISFLFLIFIMCIFFYGPLYLTYTLDFSKEVDFEVLLASVLDFSLKVLLIFYIFILLPSCIMSVNYFFNVIFREILKKYNFVLYIILVVLLFSIYDRTFMIMDGVSREDLIFENSASRIMWILSPLVTILASVAFAYKYNKKQLFLLFFCLCLVSIYSLSRSQFLSASFIFLIVYAMKGISMKSFFKLFLVGLIVLVLMSVMTIVQGRSDTLIGSVEGLFTSLFKYRSFSFYLAEYSISKINGEYEQVLFPFFGVLIERFLSLFQAISNPISVQNSSFVFDYIRVGSNIRFDANVLYPWWSWFYGVYGIMGVFIKFVFCFFVFYLIKMRLNFCFIYFLLVLCFSGGVRHPLLDNSDAYAILTLIVLDLAIIFYLSRNRNVI